MCSQLYAFSFNNFRRVYAEFQDCHHLKGLYIFDIRFIDVIWSHTRAPFWASARKNHTLVDFFSALVLIAREIAYMKMVLHKYTVSIKSHERLTEGIFHAWKKLSNAFEIGLVSTNDINLSLKWPQTEAVCNCLRMNWGSENRIRIVWLKKNKVKVTAWPVHGGQCDIKTH